MHFHMTDSDVDTDANVTYRTINLYSLEKDFIHFISDVPHVIKTTRNCLSNTGAVLYTRYMWIKGRFIIWNHIANIFYEDRECGLHILPNLTYEHIKLTPYSIINFSVI